MQFAKISTLSPIIEFLICVLAPIMTLLPILFSPSIITFHLMFFMWYRVAYGSYSEGYHRINEVIAGTIIGGTVTVWIKGQFP